MPSTTNDIVYVLTYLGIDFIVDAWDDNRKESHTRLRFGHNKIGHTYDRWYEVYKTSHRSIFEQDPDPFCLLREIHKDIC